MGGTNDGGPSVTQPLQRFNPRCVGRHELRQIQFEPNFAGTQAEKLRDLRQTQTTRQPNDTSIGLLDDTDPALHDVRRRKTDATTRSSETGMTSRL